MAITGCQLGQARPPSAATPVSVYSPPSGTSTRVTAIIVCNTTGGGVTYSIYHDDDGTTYDQSTALYYTVAIAANTTVLINDPAIWLDNASGNIAVESSSNNALTFTVYGIETS